MAHLHSVSNLLTPLLASTAEHHETLWRDQAFLSYYILLHI